MRKLHSKISHSPLPCAYGPACGKKLIETRTFSIRISVLMFATTMMIFMLIVSKSNNRNGTVRRSRIRSSNILSCLSHLSHHRFIFDCLPVCWLNDRRTTPTVPRYFRVASMKCHAEMVNDTGIDTFDRPRTATGSK